MSGGGRGKRGVEGRRCEQNCSNFAASQASCDHHSALRVDWAGASTENERVERR